MQVIVSPYLAQSLDFLQKALEDKYTRDWFMTLAQFHAQAALDSPPQYTESFQEFISTTKSLAAHMLSHDVVAAVLRYKYGYALPENSSSSSGYIKMAHLMVDNLLVGVNGENFLLNNIILLNRAIGGHFARLLAVFVVGAVIDVTWRQAPLPSWFRKFVQVNHLLQPLEQTADTVISETLGVPSRMYERIMTSAFRLNSTSDKPNITVLGPPSQFFVSQPTFVASPSHAILASPYTPIVQYVDDEDSYSSKKKSKRRKRRRRRRKSSSK